MRCFRLELLKRPQWKDHWGLKNNLENTGRKNFSQKHGRVEDQVWGAFLRGTGRRICEFQVSLYKVFGTTQRLVSKKQKKQTMRRFYLTTNDSDMYGDV